MSDNKFKNAAAKLLALNAPKIASSSVPKATQPVAAAPAAQPDFEIVWETDKKPISSITPEPEDVFGYEPEPTRSFAWGRILIIVVPALLGGAAMVVAVAPTIFGILGNLFLGLLAGGALGWIIAREV